MHCYLLQIQNSIIDKWSNQGQAPTAKISIKLGLPQILFEKLSLWRGKICQFANAIHQYHSMFKETNPDTIININVKVVAAG